MAIQQICHILGVNMRVMSYSVHVMSYEVLCMVCHTVGDHSHQICVLSEESDRYRTRQVVIILVRWIYIQLELVRCVATHRTNTLPAILCQRAPVQIQTRSECPGATLPSPLRLSGVCIV